MSSSLFCQMKSKSKAIGSAVAAIVVMFAAKRGFKLPFGSDVAISAAVGFVIAYFAPKNVSCPPPADPPAPEPPAPAPAA